MAPPPPSRDPRLQAEIGMAPPPPGRDPRSGNCFLMDKECTVAFQK